MPNYCDNNVSIAAPAGVIKELAARINSNLDKDGNPNWNETFVPIEDPNGMSSYDRETACRSWGTKWEVDAYSLLIGEKRIDVKYNTAWGPNQPVSEAIIAEYEDRGLTLHHRYDEPGMQFCGVITNLPVDIVGHFDQAHMSFTEFTKTRIAIWCEDDTGHYGGKNLGDMGVAILRSKEDGTQYKNGDLVLGDQGGGVFIDTEDGEAYILFQDGDKVELFKKCNCWFGDYDHMEEEGHGLAQRVRTLTDDKALRGGN